MIQGSGIAIVGSTVTGSTVQQGLTGADLGLVLTAIATMRADLRAANFSPDAKAKIEEALQECDAEIENGSPKVSRLFTLLTRAGEIYRTVGATPGVIAAYETAQNLLTRAIG